MIRLLLLLAGCANEPPSPPLVAIEPELPRTGDTLHATVTAESLDLQGGQEISYRYAWYRDGALIDDLAEAQVDPSHTAKGETWTVEVVPSDGIEEGPPAAVSVTIGNTAPSAEVALDPASPTSSEDVTCAPTSLDPDGDVLSYEYRWFVNGVGLGVEPVLKHTYFERGDLVQCEAEPYDGKEHGEPATSPETTIGNSPPEVVEVTISPAAPATGDLVTASATTTDFEGDAVTVSFTWYVNDVESGTGEQFDGSDLVRGDLLRAEGVPDDGMDAGDPVSDEVTVGNAPPSLDAIVLKPSTVYTDDELEVRVGDTSDPDGDSVSVTVDWYVDGVLVASGSEKTLDGATWFSRDQVVEVVVTPNDGTEDGEALTKSVTVSNSIPSITGAALSASTVYETDALSCKGSGWSDADGDTARYKYAWYVAGVSSSSAASLDGDDFDKGDEIYCELTPWDGTDTGTAYTTSSITVSNSPPGIAFVDVSPETASTREALTCSVTIDASDADDDTVTYSYAWSVDGTSTSYTTATLTADQTTAGTWTCTVTPSDGEEEGMTSSDSAEVIGFQGTLSLTQADLELLGAASSDHAGRGLAGPGDLDGDGYDDLLVGALYADDSASNGGAVYAVHGGVSGSVSLGAADYTLTGANANGYAGASVNGAGDVDGDGEIDLIVGAPGESSGVGGAYLVYGPVISGTLTATGVQLQGTGSGNAFGYVTAGLGDMDGDGIGEVAVASSNYSSVYSRRGVVFIVGGAPTSSVALSTEADASILGDAGNEYVGIDASGPGDVDGDGYSDVLVGATGRGSGAGDGLLFLGPLSGSVLGSDADARFRGDTGDGAGAQVDALGDVNGDGYVDLAVSAPSADVTYSNDGAVYLVLGSATIGDVSLGTGADAQISGQAASDSAGEAVVGPGDMNGDGYDELAFGERDDEGGTDAGAVYVFLGPVSGTMTSADADVTRTGEAASDLAGLWLAAAGDVDGDGLYDLLIGAQYLDDGGSNAGGAYVLFGGTE